jgi:hypothetical protein
MYYTNENFPEHIKFVKDTIENREKLKSLLGEPALMFDDFVYIQINIEDNTWRTTFSYEWLYRNQPPLLTLDEFINQYKTNYHI